MALSPEAVAALGGLPAGHVDGPCCPFPQPQVGRVFLQPRHADTLTHWVKNLARAAGLESVRLHDMRRTHITEGLSRGVPSRIMQSAAGHSDFATTQPYSKTISGEALWRAVTQFLDEDRNSRSPGRLAV